MKLALGTVQFGIPYGISNKKGQTSIAEVKKILVLAKQNNIKLLDTAPVYGQSEQILGNLIKNDNHFKVITKTIRFDTSQISHNECNKLQDSIQKSLGQLQKKSIYGILVHKAENFLTPGGKKLFKVLYNFKQQGLISKIGFSVYTAEQIDKLLESFEFDLVQLPLNIFDQRLLISDHLKKLKKANVEIHARSIFLQGLLLTPLKEIPPYFEPIKKHLKKYHLILKTNNYSSLEATLNFIKNVKEIDHIVIGINNKEQLIENIKAYNQDISLPWKKFAYFDKTMLDPQKWHLQK